MEALQTNHSWDQLPDETDTAYHRFSIYLEMGPDRSLEKARQKLGKSSGYIRQLHEWSSKYDWVQRVSEYDSHMVRKALKNREDVLDEITAKLLRAANKAADELINLALGDGQELTDSETLNKWNQKLKAIESILDRVGAVKMKEQPDLDKPIEVNNYIQNIYERIRVIRENE